MGETSPRKEEPLPCARGNERGKVKQERKIDEDTRTHTHLYIWKETVMQLEERENHAGNGNRGCCKQAVGDT